MKTKLWTGLALALLLALLCCGAASANDSGTCGENLNWTLDSGTETISRGEGAPLTASHVRLTLWAFKPV